jgi:hypothetical protein
MDANPYQSPGGKNTVTVRWSIARGWQLGLSLSLIVIGLLVWFFSDDLMVLAVHTVGGGFGVYPTENGRIVSIVAEGPFRWMLLIRAVAALFLLPGGLLLFRRVHNR